MPDYREWVPDEAVAQLTVRRALQDVEDPVKMAAELIKEALPLATMSMTHLAIHSPTEMIRLQAAKYILDKSFGEGKDIRMPDAKPAWDKIFDTVVVEVDNIVNRHRE
jgi:hypothetical protein